MLWISAILAAALEAFQTDKRKLLPVEGRCIVFDEEWLEIRGFQRPSEQLKREVRWLLERGVPEELVRQISPTALFKRTHVGPFLLKSEGWADPCLEDGIGPCSLVEHGEENAQWPAGGIADFADQCIEEVELRERYLEPPDPDAAPDGYQLVWRGMFPTGDEDYRLLEQSVWVKRQLLLFLPP